ncbi:unnamed protein product, partial [Ectocarpus sp. 12 AP-2014]
SAARSSGLGTTRRVVSTVQVRRRSHLEGFWRRPTRDATKPAVSNDRALLLPSTAVPAPRGMELSELSMEMLSMSSAANN